MPLFDPVVFNRVNHTAGPGAGGNINKGNSPHMRRSRPGPMLDLIEHHEGRRAFPYHDTVGKLTIGVVRNLTDRGLSDDEIN